MVAISGHSRASVRHAVRRLEVQQLVEVFPRRGAQISPVDYTREFRLLELRRVVEGLVARSAAKRASDNQRNTLTRLAQQCRDVAQTLDQTSMIELDFETFSVTLDAADNPFAAKAMTSIKGLSRRFWVLHHQKHGDVRQMANAHEAIAASIAKADSDAAEQAVSHLIDNVEAFTLEVVGYSPRQVRTST